MIHGYLAFLTHKHEIGTVQKLHLNIGIACYFPDTTTTAGDDLHPQKNYKQLLYFRIE